jgi:hypothetical protein
MRWTNSTVTDPLAISIANDDAGENVATLIMWYVVPSVLYIDVDFIFEVDYPTMEDKIYSDEEDQHLICCSNYYMVTANDVYERIQKDILEFPIFFFEWFFKSRLLHKLQRRHNMLLG